MVNKLEKSARQFLEAAWAQLGQDHPLPHIFAGLMMVYYTDESDLQWVDIAMRPWFEDAEKKSAIQELEITRSFMWILASAQARKRKEKAV